MSDKNNAPSVISSFADLANIPSLTGQNSVALDETVNAQAFAAEFVDAQDMLSEPGTIVGTAGQPITEISMDGREVIHQPLVIESMLSTHSPYRFKVDPTRVTFDGSGLAPALGVGADTFAFTPSGDAKTPTSPPGAPFATRWPIGIVLRVVINDTQVGEGSVGLATTEGFAAEWAVTNTPGESTLCLLSHNTDYIVTSRSTVTKAVAPATIATGEESSNVQPANDNYFFTPRNDQTFNITGQNVIIHVYPIYVTREIQAITAAAFASDRLGELAGFFAEGYLSK